MLEAEGFARLKGKRVGLVTNQTGRSRGGSATIDLLAAAPDVKLVALFSPEHGIRGAARRDASRSSVDEKSGLPIHSLYGESRRPTDAMLDGPRRHRRRPAGCRSALLHVSRDARLCAWRKPRTRKLPVVVLDRPNPINGFDIEGPYQDAPSIGFNGYLPMPIRHGLTHRRAGASVQRREQDRRGSHRRADEELAARRLVRRRPGLPWTNPSPNLRNMVAAALYPGIGAIEGTNLSVGPRHRFAVRADRRALDRRCGAGVRAQRARSGWYPLLSGDVHAGGRREARRSGLSRSVSDCHRSRSRLQPVRVGLEIAAALSSRYGQQFKLEDATYLLGSRSAIEKIRAGTDPGTIAASWRADEERWRRIRAPYLLY